MASPFIIKPSNTLHTVTEENATKSFVWVIDGCEWEVRIVTENYTLYPNINPQRVPIKLNTDYNVSVTPEVHLCEDSAINTNVSLSINLNSKVLGYIEYVTCKVYSTYDDTVTYRSRVNFKVLAAPPPTDTITTKTITGITEGMMITEIKTISINDYSVTELSMHIEMKDNVTTDSGYRHSLHFGAVLINFVSLFLYHLFFESL